MRTSFAFWRTGCSRRASVAFAIGLMLAACSGSTVPDLATLERLAGSWRIAPSQQGIEGELRIWRDGAVLVKLRTFEGKVQLLSRLEQDEHGISFAIGDRWAAPARLRWENESLWLIWPSQPPRKVRLLRVQ